MTQGQGKGKGRPRERRVQGTGFSAASGRRNVGAVVPYIPPITEALSYCFGLRVLKDTYSGPLVRLRRSGDDAEKDFFPVNGIIDAPAIVSWLGGADGFVRTWYDQSGNGRDSIETTAANQPKYIASHNGRPALLGDGVDKHLIATGADIAQPIEVSWVWQSDTTSGFLFDSVDAAKRCTCFIRGTGNLGYNAGATVDSGSDLTDANTHYTSVQFDGVSSKMRDNGADQSSGNTGVENKNGLTLLASNALATHLDGHFYEYIEKDGLFSAGQRLALEANQAEFFGVS